MDKLLKNKNLVKYILGTVLGILIIISFVYQVIKINSEPYKTEVAVERKYQGIIDTKAFVVRDEAYLTASDPNGTIVSIAEDGKRVGSGETVAISFKNAESAATYVKINELKSEIQYYSQLKNRVGVGTNSPTSYNSMIDSALIDYICSAQNQMDGEYDDSLKDLRDAITTKQLAIGQTISVDEKLTSLQAQLVSLQSKELGYTEIASPNPGYYIGSVDGYENSMNYSEAVDADIETVNKLIASNPITPPANVMGKLVDAFNWYLLCSVPYKQSGSIKVGETITVNVPNSSAGTIKCTVVKKGEKTGDDIVLILKCGIMNRDVSKLRIAEINIITDEYTGFRISNKAIREIDSQKGVYILRGNMVQFKKIEILYSTEDYSIIKSVSDDNSFVRQYDTIITEGVDLYDGKVIS